MTEATTRLHITPLTPDILPSVLPASLQQSATDISFHSIPTFPENSYGYFTLPTMEADKIKKKLNGSILKGKKFKVETARPQKRQRDEEDLGVEESADGKKKEKKSKKRKAEDGVLEGYELPPDRKVKRGWTEPSNAKKEKRNSEKKGKDDKKAKPQPKSKYTEKSECLFRTAVPPNRSSAEAADEKKAKKKKKSSQESVVHEFEKTVTHPSFLRSTEASAAPTTTFEEGKGWVDAGGNVKEATSEKARKDNFCPGQIAGAKVKRSGRKSASKERVKTPKPSSESEDWTSSSGSSCDESSDAESETSSSSDAASESSIDEVSAQPAPAKETSDPINGTAAPSEGSDSEMTNEGAHNADESSKEIHPLEALFKRPALEAPEDQPALDTNAGFSFFGNDDIESDNEPQTMEPQTPFTPFTKRDLQARGLRSAAPTPDTAMANRRMDWAEADEVDADASVDTPLTKSPGVDGSPGEETEFAKWFWEHRGENNRAWKKRRRDAAKEQRQRENRKRGLKGKS